MKNILRCLTYAIVCAAGGCGTVEKARQAQREAEPVSSGRTYSGPKVVLESANLPELVVFALTNRPSMVSAALDVRDARLAMKEIAADAPLASSTPWNAASLSASLGYSESSTAAKFSDLKAKTHRGKASGSLSLELLVWDFGRNAARARAQAENVLAAELSLAEEGFNVFNEVSSAYFTFVECEALREVAETNVQQYLDHLARAEDMFREGEAQRLDVFRARLDLARSRESLVASSNDVVVAKAKLTAALGIDVAQGAEISISGETGLFRATGWLAESSSDAAEAFSYARTNAPSMQISRARLRAASAQVDYAVADLYPSVSGSLSLNWTDPLWYWRWGANAVQSLFTGWRRTASVDRAVVAMQKAQQAVETAEKTLSSQLEIAIAERNNAREAFAAAEESVRQSSENLETVKARYEVGDVSRIDFSDAVSSYCEALASEIKAFYRGQLAEASLLTIEGIDPSYSKTSISLGR